MEQNQDAQKNCGCGRSACGCGSSGSCGSCWSKMAIGLWLLLAGAIGGYLMGQRCGYHHMMACHMPMAMEAPVQGVK